MSRWRRSVDELAARRRQQSECERAQEALSKVTSCFQQLAVSLGSSADCSFLRDEMDETRALAHRICSGLSRRLVRLLADCDSAPSGVEDRQMSERLWVLFLSALENFLSDLRKTSDVPVAFWSVEATQPAWAEAHDELAELDDSLEDLMEVEVVSNSKMAACCPPPCCGLSCVG
eukprot:superscaffoldBa00012574_g25703